MNRQSFGSSTFRTFAVSQLGEAARTAPLAEILESLQERAREEGWGRAISGVRGDAEKPLEPGGSGEIQG